LFINADWSRFVPEENKVFKKWEQMDLKGAIFRAKVPGFSD
jgi:hypothetical protein